MDMQEGLLEVVCITGLVTVTQTEADWAAVGRRTYELSVKWFADTAAPWMSFYMAGKPGWHVYYPLPALEQHLTLICEPPSAL